MTPKDGLSPRERAFVAQRATGQSILETAKSIGVSLRQATRYSVKPSVRLALQTAQGDTLHDVVLKMNAGSHTALDVLSLVMDDGTLPPGTRIRAAEIWLTLAFKARELLEFDRRITELETRLGHEHEHETD